MGHRCQVGPAQASCLWAWRAFLVSMQANGSSLLLRYRVERERWAQRSDEAVAGAASTPPLSGLTL